VSLPRLFTALFPVIIACGPPKVDQESPGPQLITQSEVDASRAANAYEVIQKLHPNFLHDRGETSLSKQRSTPYPTVYVDGQEFGLLPSLRSIPASQIATIRLYHAWEATTTYGSGKGGAVIEIATRR
jgi:hypothetical protein